MTTPQQPMRDVRKPIIEALAAFHAAGPLPEGRGPTAWLSAIPAAKSWTQLEMLTAFSFTASILLTLAQTIDAANKVEGVQVDPAMFIQGCLTLLAGEETGHDSV